MDQEHYNVMLADYSAHSPPRQHHDIIEFIPHGQLAAFDLFSASWWQSVSRFNLLHFNKLQMVEDSAFIPIFDTTPGGKEDALMTMDWLDFSVEHLSKWWRVMGVKGEVYAMSKLQSYTQRVMSSEQESNVMESTLAIVPYGVRSSNMTTQHVWIHSLTATMASLMRHGVGRIVVVGYYEPDYQLAKKAFQLLLRYKGGFHEDDVQVHAESESFSATLGSIELAYVKATGVRTQAVEVNVPRGALLGLQQALNHQRGNDQEQWVGKTPQQYKYIFLTEADQILHARPSRQFIQEMDKGNIMVPHRLQPIPHPLDVEGLDLDSNSVLPQDEFPHVHELGRMDSCCDSNDRAGVEQYGKCGTFWWLCGFDVRNETHKRLSSYEFMRLTSGTGIVNLASNEHSRKCIPANQPHDGCRQVRRAWRQQMKDAASNVV